MLASIRSVGLSTRAGQGVEAAMAGLMAGVALPERDVGLAEMVREALADAAVEALPPRAGLILATASGARAMGWEAWHRAALGGSEEPPAPTCERQGLALPSVEGPTACVSMACASGLAAVVLATDWIRLGRAEEVLVIAVDQNFPFVEAGFRRLGVLGHCVPFRGGSVGFSVGSAAVALRLARGPGGVPIRGTGLGSDAWSALAPHPEGRGLAQALRMALREGVVEGVDLVAAHGTGTPANDRSEIAALREVFGVEPPVMVTKPVMGHPMGAAGALDLALLAHALGRFDLPTLGGGRVRASTAVAVAAAFGGFNAAVVLGEGGSFSAAPSGSATPGAAVTAIGPSGPRDPTHVAVEEVLVALAPAPGAGLILSTPRGCVIADLRHHTRLVEEGPDRVSGRHFAGTTPGAPLVEAMIRLGLRGPVMVLLDPLEVAEDLARDWLALGRCSEVVVLGVSVEGEDARGEGARVWATGRIWR